jgi:hypothetical protein|tara:strand:+ start:2022 stop:2144 length:123 start_codon:yes stop_codon:yes gene_type:complete
MNRASFPSLLKKGLTMKKSKKKPMKKVKRPVMKKTSKKGY